MFEVFCTKENEILVVVPVQSYLADFIESQVVGFGIQALVCNPFLDKQLTLGYREKSLVECILSKSSDW